MGAKNGSSAPGFSNVFAGFSLGSAPGVGACFLFGSVLGFLAPLCSSGVASRWVFAAGRLGLPLSLHAHHLFVVLSMLFLASKVWRLGKRCDAVEGLAVRFRKADGLGGTLCTGGVICGVCGSKIPAWKGNLEPIVRGISSKQFLSKAVGEFDEDEDGDIAVLRRRVEEERRLKEAALEELEKERRAAASAADEAMAKISCLQSEKALVEREARQFREMAEQRQLYDRHIIESLQWVVARFGRLAQP